MKASSVLQIVALVLILIFSGVSLLVSYETHTSQANNASQLNEQYNKVSQELATIINALPNSTYVVLAHNETITQGSWLKSVNVTKYRTVYLYFDTTSGAPNATLSYYFDTSIGYIESSTFTVEIGANAGIGIVKIDVLGGFMVFSIPTMTNGNYITTSIYLYLVT